MQFLKSLHSTCLRGTDKAIRGIVYNEIPPLEQKISPLSHTLKPLVFAVRACSRLKPSIHIQTVPLRAPEHAYELFIQTYFLQLFVYYSIITKVWEQFSSPLLYACLLWSVTQGLWTIALQYTAQYQVYCSFLLWTMCIITAVTDVHLLYDVKPTEYTIHACPGQMS